MKMMKAAIAGGAVVALLAGVAGSGGAQAQTKPMRTTVGGDVAPKSFLWVGNSFFYYNNSMHSHVREFAQAADPADPWRGVSITISGSGIDWHDLNSYFRPNAVGRYSFEAGNTVVFNKPGKQFDAVIIMDCSQCPINPQLKDTFHTYAKSQTRIITDNGARPIFFMSWAYKDKPEMTAQLAEAYTVAGNENDALVIPAGLAFAKAIARRPELEFYQPDKRHPTLIGTYLAAATVYAAISGKSPVGSSYTAGLAPDTAAFLQNTAWDTVTEYYGK